MKQKLQKALIRALVSAMKKAAFYKDRTVSPAIIFLQLILSKIPAPLSSLMSK
jgi:hypothetical protein